MSRAKGQKVAIIDGWATSSAITDKGIRVRWNAAMLRNAVRAKRERQRLTWRALAKLLGIHPTVLSRLNAHCLPPEGDNLAAVLYWLGAVSEGYLTLEAVPA